MERESAVFVRKIKIFKVKNGDKNLQSLSASVCHKKNVKQNSSLWIKSEECSQNLRLYWSRLVQDSISIFRDNFFQFPRLFNM